MECDSCSRIRIARAHQTKCSNREQYQVQTVCFSPILATRSKTFYSLLQLHLWHRINLNNSIKTRSVSMTHSECRKAKMLRLIYSLLSQLSLRHSITNSAQVSRGSLKATVLLTRDGLIWKWINKFLRPSIKSCISPINRYSN